MKSNEKTLRSYLIWAFALAWALQALAVHFALDGQPQLFRAALALSMYAPFAAVLLARIPLRGMGWKPALRGKTRYFFAAWLGGAVLALLGGALYYLLFPGQFDPGAGAALATLGEEGLAQLDAQGISPQLFILIQIGASLTYAPFINMFFALGEEVGWRGALYPMLRERCGVAKGRLLGGLIWGIWHWPVMILAGYNYGTQYWGAPVTGPLLFCLVTFCLGVLFDWLYEKTHCIWIPALAHGAFNAVAGLPSLFLSVEAAPSALSGSASIDTAPSTLLGPTMIGLIAGLPMFLLAFLLWRRTDEKKD
ncbi:MAG: CPBP family intramembrane metalloprotease [Oscillospiraceae bacterium]|nr:CPBP family intramembrane metalloprotease [Oscillospiraceae bacterium]